MRKYALFLGCIAPANALGYDISTRKVAKALEIELVDLNFSCCGFPILGVKHETSLLLAARNLAIAEKEGLDILTICGACSFVLSKVQKRYEQDKAEKINLALNKLGLDYQGSIKVKHFARMLYEDYGPQKLRKAVKRSLNNLRLAVHYGCYYHKPSDVYDYFEDPDSPISLDKLVSVTGATSIEYDEKMQCCGGALLGIEEQKSLTMSMEKLEHVKEAKADAMVIVCPFCGVLYDSCQRDIEKKFNKSFKIPVLYYTQVLGLALGLEAKSLALDKNFVRTDALLGKI
ncbi:MAG: CoB--CoM heterodisulfide reductase iron-sulfur subunit B family protein [Thermoplasmata archaeon]